MKSAPPPPASPETVRVDRTEAAPDSDGATRQTIRQMCDYIEKVQADPKVRQAAAYAWKKFGQGSDNIGMRVWGVYWYVKHCIKFQQDEDAMFRIGEPGQQDVLTAPDVLLRMDSPAEDCDGFTMLVCALLSLLRVKWVIVTVAVDPSDRTRWSHVFPMAIVNDKPLPLDASHGKGPGWMVPSDRIFRWQAWDETGTAVDVGPPAKLGNYVHRGRGFGDICNPDAGDVCDSQGNAIPPGETEVPGMPGFYEMSTSQVTAPPASGSSTSGSSSGGILSFLNSLVNAGASVAKIAETPTATVTLPNGTVVRGVQPTSLNSLFSGSSLTSFLPMIALFGIGLFALSAISKKSS